MAHELAFADALRPTPVRVLRLPLRDYSLAHEILLIRYRNPLRCMSEEAFSNLGFNLQSASLQQAVLICSRRLAQTNNRWRWLKLWKWSQKGCDLPTQIAAFQQYIRAGLESPKFSPAASDYPGRCPGSPELVHIFQWLCSNRHRLCLVEYHSAEMDLWDYPLALARLEYYSALETEGKCRLQNNDEAANDFSAWVEEQERRVASGEIKLPDINPSK